MRRTYAYRRKLPHFQWIDKSYFITFCTKNRELLLPHSRTLVLQTCLAGNGGKYKLHAAVVMPDHVHLILTPLYDDNGETSLPEILHEIKGVSAHRINRLLGRKGPLWQEESFDRAIREVENFRGNIDYILGNPVRSGLAANPFSYQWLWRESSYHGRGRPCLHTFA
jgi:REP element-mobilizing transposase RayT